MRRVLAMLLLSACGGDVSSSPTTATLGFNYDHDRDDRLLEEHWDDFDTVLGDLDEMRDLGAEVVRIHLQLGAFLTADGINEHSFTNLGRFVGAARERGLKLLITGLGAYRASADPAWYVALDEGARWDAQARFWSAVAQRLSGDAALFGYDLMNEPVVPTEVATDWTPGELAGLSFVQNLVLDLDGRDPSAVAHAWRMKMIAAIREHDADVDVTVGQLPFTTQPGFRPAEVAADVDFLSVHVYPDGDDLAASGAVVDAFAAEAKPLVVSETFPLNCSAAELERFIAAHPADGWIGFYWGETRAELEAAHDIPSALMLAWLDLFARLTGR